MEKTVVKAFSLVEALARGAPSRGISELGRELGLTKSNVHRLLDTLQSLGYVTRSDNGTYALSFELWRIGMSVISRLDIKGMALPYLQKLAHETGETARLTVFQNDQGICIEQVQSSSPIGVTTGVGGTLLAYCSATGKALLAYQPPEVIERVARNLEKFTPRTVNGREELLQELARIRERGYAINTGEWRESVRGVGAPVWNGEGKVVAAIGISGPSTRLSGKALQSHGTVVRSAGLRLSAELGHLPAGRSLERATA
jgi:DNA-binding IclR family transcriptional regulator